MVFQSTKPTGWDDYLIEQRNAALRATEPEIDSAKVALLPPFQYTLRPRHAVSEH